MVGGIKSLNPVINVPVGWVFEKIIPNVKNPV
jgi:hypothetical protein